jgi:hypothetical protein
MEGKRVTSGMVLLDESLQRPKVKLPALSQDGICLKRFLNQRRSHVVRAHELLVYKRLNAHIAEQ